MVRAGVWRERRKLSRHSRRRRRRWRSMKIERDLSLSPSHNTTRLHSYYLFFGTPIQQAPHLHSPLTESHKPQTIEKQRCWEQGEASARPRAPTPPRRARASTPSGQRACASARASTFTRCVCGCVCVCVQSAGPHLPKHTRRSILSHTPPNHATTQSVSSPPTTGQGQANRRLDA